MTVNAIPFAKPFFFDEDIESIKDRIEEVLRSGWLTDGPVVRQFEEEFACFVGTKYTIGLNSCTAALHATLLALGLRRGDEVIVPSDTFVATANAALYVSAKPVFADSDPQTFNISVSDIERRITKKTKAIIVVHLGGNPCDMKEIQEIAEDHKLIVIEDCAHAHGAKYKGRRTGSLGNAACFSFYPSKNLGACGEGGAVTTNDPELAKKVRMLRDHGSVKKYEHDFPAYNLRLEGIQGGILAVKLPHLDGWNESRRALAKRYNELFAGSKVVTPQQMPYAEHVYHLYVVVVEDRETLRKALTEQGIENGLHYPVPLHLQKAYAYLGYKKGDFPVSEHVAANHVSLPMYAELPVEHVEHVAKTVREIVECQPVATSSGRA